MFLLILSTGALTNKVPGVMKNAPIRFILDGGQHMQLSEKAPDQYRLQTLSLYPTLMIET